MEQLKDVFKIGGRYTIFSTNSGLAITSKHEITVRAKGVDKVVFCPKGKRKMYILRYERKAYASAPVKPFKGAIFEGWDQPITCDTDQETESRMMCRSMRSNACYNFMGSRRKVWEWIENGQLNPNFEHNRVLAIQNNIETVVYPESVLLERVSMR